MIASTDLKSTRNPRALQKYAAVTAVASPTNMAIYIALMRWTRASPTLCSFLAAASVTGPTFAASRRWVWKMSRQEARRRQAVVFWMLSGVNVTCVSVTLTSLQAHQAPHMITVLAPLVVYTGLWLLRYAFLNRVVFQVCSGSRSVSEDAAISLRVSSATEPESWV